ncbi:ABC transporter substrate-binding protein [Ornithinimicrobium faecis]|uniref:ABC transporter substrate-binding protein n=1 Tax=Ornithinimicrobium faecis TaxID=2934158 RepID=A0ABY4YX98_9MICO|nr:ABC transporter substrate-binding protein [Ornithinimicrobium sp. HY1793]USQ81276.1 ABC transporter substrate-binding protein [Ornithinimicrobium sp. HY1793]
MHTETSTSRPSRLRTALPALAGAAALVLAGCSGSGDAGSSSAAAGAGDGTGTAAHFTMGLGTAPNSLDVTRHFDANVMGIMSLFTEPIERLSGDGTLTPNIAEEVTQPDDLTIVYTIREGVEFSNGEPLTPEDIVWSIEHVTDVEAGAQTASLTASVESAEVTGEHEVTVKLSQPDPAARASLALVALVQDADFGEENAAELGQPTAVPVGTGPYVVTSSTPEAVELERNANYWGEAPVPDQITVSFFGSDDTGQAAMRSGSADGMLLGNPVSLPQFESISGTNVYSTPALMSHFWSLDTSTAPFDDIHVRRAFAHAIDREGLLKASFGTSARPLDAMIPRDLLTPIASEGEVDDFLAGLTPIEFDLDKAAEELAQSKYADGFEVELPVMAASWMELSALNLQQNLEPLGVTITTRTVTPQQWVEMVFSHDTGQIFPMSFAAAVPDPGLLRRVVSEEARTQAGGYNFANWAPPELQDLAANLQETTDDAGRFEAATTILTQISEEVPYIPMYQPDFVMVLANGFTFTEAPTVIDVASGTWIQNLRAG